MNTFTNKINETEIDNFISNLKSNLNVELNKGIENINFYNEVNNFNQNNINQYYNGLLINSNNKLQKCVTHSNYLFEINYNLYYIKKQIYFYNKSEHFANTHDINMYNIRINELKNIKKEVHDMKLIFINYLKIYLKSIKNDIKDISNHLLSDISTSITNDNNIKVLNSDLDNIINYIDMAIFSLNRKILVKTRHEKYKKNFIYYGKKLGILSLSILFYFYTKSSVID